MAYQWIIWLSAVALVASSDASIYDDDYDTYTQKYYEAMASGKFTFINVLIFSHIFAASVIYVFSVSVVDLQTFNMTYFLHKNF